MDGYLLGVSDVKLFAKDYFSKNAKGTVIVVPEFGASCANYDYFASLLSERLNVFLYDQRGQGKSEGVFSLDSAVSDLEKIVDSKNEPVALCAHSFGSRVAIDVAKRYEQQGRPLLGVYLIQPCLGVESFGHKNGNASLSWVKSKLSGKKNPLIVQVADLSVNDCVLEKTPAGYMIASKDDALFISEHDVVCQAKKFHALFKNRFVGIDWNDSHEVKELGHWLNFSNGAPLLKEESGKNAEEIARRISYFFLRVFEKN